jgi:2-haloacid dehalogenase
MVAPATLPLMPVPGCCRRPGHWNVGDSALCLFCNLICTAVIARKPDRIAQQGREKGKTRQATKEK